MSMFDCVRCELPLPDGLIPVQIDDFGDLQTQAFANQLDLYTITVAGRLLLSPDLTGQPADDIAFDGAFVFYGMDPSRHLHSYTATFISGQLAQIQTVSPEDAAIFSDRRAKVQEGIADIEAGDVLDEDAAFAALEAKFGKL